MELHRIPGSRRSPGETDGRSRRRYAALLGACLLLAGLWQIRREVHRRVAAIGVHLRHDRPKPSSREVGTLVPADGDLTAVRAELTPGARVMVFPDPPVEASTVPGTVAEAESYRGLLEDAAGRLSYQSVSARRVPAFLAQGRNARRWALHPLPGPAGLTATV